MEPQIQGGGLHHLVMVIMILQITVIVGLQVVVVIEGQLVLLQLQMAVGLQILPLYYVVAKVKLFVLPGSVRLNENITGKLSME